MYVELLPSWIDVRTASEKTRAQEAWLDTPIGIQKGIVFEEINCRLAPLGELSKQGLVSFDPDGVNVKIGHRPVHAKYENGLPRIEYAPRVNVKEKVDPYEKVYMKKLRAPHTFTHHRNSSEHTPLCQ